MKYNFPPHVPSKDQLYSLKHIKNPLKIISYQFDRRGDTYSIKSNWVPYRLIFTKNAELTRHFLQRNHKIYDKSVYQTEKLGKYIGKGLLTNSGSDWKRQRQLIQPGFNHQRINALKDRILIEIEQFFAQVPKDDLIDLYPLCNQLTFNIVAKSLFSSDISKHQIKIIAETLTAAQEMFMKETFHPIVELFLRLTNRPRKIIRRIDEIRLIMQSIIDQRRNEGPKGDLLDMLLEARYEDNGKPMTDKQLIDELLILFVAGHETTANALSFTFYLLGKHPSKKAKLQDEIRALGDQAFDIDRLFANSYGQNILRESMRLFPPAWTTDRQALEDDQLGEFSWPKGTILIVSNYHMNRDPNLWPNPEAFVPSRFDEPDAKQKFFIPFGKGPRYCIGEHFAMLEMILVLRHFFTKYDFVLEQDDINVQLMVTMRPDRVMGRIIELAKIS